MHMCVCSLWQLSSWLTNTVVPISTGAFSFSLQGPLLRGALCSMQWIARGNLKQQLLKLQCAILSITYHAHLVPEPSITPQLSDLPDNILQRWRLFTCAVSLVTGGGGAMLFHLAPIARHVSQLWSRLIPLSLGSQGMAIFGVQLVVSVIVASFLNKLTPYYSFGRWLSTTKLRRHLPPSDASLRPHVAAAAPTNRSGKRLSNASRRNAKEQLVLDPEVTVPRSVNLEVEAVPLSVDDVEQLYYYSDLEWLLDLSCAVLAVRAASCAYFHWYHPPALGSEYDQSVLWVLVLLGYTLKSLFVLTSVYFTRELASERSIWIVFTALFFVTAMSVLLVDEGLLDFGLEGSYVRIADSLQAMVNSESPVGGGGGEDSTKLLPKWAYKFFLALLASVVGSILIFPGFRVSEMHFDALTHSKSHLLKTLLHFSYVSPALCLVLWIRPFASGLMAHSTAYFHLYRIAVLVSMCLLRVCLYKVYMQSYLDLGKRRIQHLKLEHGRISISQLRLRASGIYKFYAGAAIQYLAPVLILFCLTLLLGVTQSVTSLPPEEVGGEGPSLSLPPFPLLNLGLYHGYISFLCWWVCLVYFVTSGLGSAIHSYMYK